MNIVKALRSDILEKDLGNGLIEIKGFWCNTIRYRLFTLHGELHGEYKEWWDNGVLKIHCYYVKGELHGEYKCWLDDGSRFLDQVFSNGDLIKSKIR